jgi:hypothetical protein
MSRLRGWARRAIDIALVVYALAFAARLLHGPFELDLGPFDVSFDHFRKPLTAVAVLVFARWGLTVGLDSALIAALQERFGSGFRTVERPPARLVALVVGLVWAVAVGFSESLDHFDFRPFWSDPLARISAPSEMLLERFGEEYAVLEAARRVIPADAAVLLETDQRPYFASYYLHPRRVYMHPSAVEQLDRRNTHAPELRVELHPHPAAEACPLLESRGIGWRFDYYPDEPGRSRVERLDANGRKP